MRPVVAAWPCAARSRSTRCAAISSSLRSSSSARRRPPAPYCRTSSKPRSPSRTKLESEPARSRLRWPPSPDERETSTGTSTPTTAYEPSASTAGSTPATVPRNAPMAHAMSTAMQMGLMVWA